MADATSSEARARIEIAAPAEACWRAISDPAQLAGWHPERVDGEFAPGREVVFSWESLGQSISLEVLEADAPHRLVLRGSPPNRAPQRQEIAIRDRGGVCDVEIAHTGFRAGPGGDDERGGTEAGWRAALAMLKLYLERYPSEPRTVAAAMGATTTSPRAGYEALAAAFGFGREPTSGGDARLALPGDRSRRAEVLVAAPPYQVLASLPEIRGFVALRAFSSGAADAPNIAILAAQIGTWGGDAGAVSQLRPAVEAIVDSVIQSLGGPVAEA